MSAQRVPEEYIHYVWRYGLYRSADLLTTTKEPIQVVHPGQQNRNAGPDFSNARLRIGDQDWAGNVEIHFNSSDWDAHGHQRDIAYDSVILHVVVHHDREIQNTLGATIPTLSLSPYLSIDHFRGYQRFIGGKDWVPCASQIASVDPFKWIQVKERAAIERLESKSERIIDRYAQLGGDWEHVVYRLLARAFGGKVNSDPFEQLTIATPLPIVRKHADNIPLLEALFLGQAGYISEDFSPETVYEEQCLRDYSFLKNKYSLVPMPNVAWKNARIRPSSAPQVRIVQFAKLWVGNASLHTALIEEDVDTLKARFSVNSSSYWKEHIGLQQSASPRDRSVGESLLDRILINVVAPIRFANGLRSKVQRHKDSALSLLENLAAEDNSIIRKWRGFGVKADHALDSQGLLQLKQAHCDEKKCLSCTIGQTILK